MSSDAEIAKLLFACQQLVQTDILSKAEVAQFRELVQNNDARALSLSSLTDSSERQVLGNSIKELLQTGHEQRERKDSVTSRRSRFNSIDEPGFRPRPLNILSVKTAASDTAGEVDEVDEHSRVNRERKPNRQSLPDKLPTMIPKLP